MSSTGKGVSHVLKKIAIAVAMVVVLAMSSLAFASHDVEVGGICVDLDGPAIVECHE